jgi:hypothetical protein
MGADSREMRKSPLSTRDLGLDTGASSCPTRRDGLRGPDRGGAGAARRGGEVPAAWTDPRDAEPAREKPRRGVTVWQGEQPCVSLPAHARRQGWAPRFRTERRSSQMDPGRRRHPCLRPQARPPRGRTRGAGRQGPPPVPVPESESASTWGCNAAYQLRLASQGTRPSRSHQSIASSASAPMPSKG